MEDQEYYILFSSAQDAMALYTKIKGAGIEATLSPTPRNADHCCGVSVYYFKGEDREKIEVIIKENNLKIDKFFQRPKDINPNRNKFC